MATQTPPATSRQMNIVYGISNLANYIVGAGILGLPFVFSKTGWAAGCFLILLAAFATALSFDFLLRASTASGCYSYDALALRTGGTRLQKLVKVVIIIDSFGPLSGYMIVIGDALQVFIASFDSTSSPALSKAALTAYAVLLFIVPLCFLKTLDKLGFTSILSLVPLVYLLIFQMVHLANNGVAPSGSFSPGVGGGGGIFVCLPIVVFAYSSQQALFPIYADLRGAPDLPSPKGAAASIVADKAAADSSDAEAPSHASGQSHDGLDHSIRDQVELQVMQVRADHVDAPSDAGHPHEIEATQDEGSIELSLAAKMEGQGPRADFNQSLCDMNLIVRVTMVVTSFCYILCAALGYLAFPFTADGNILKTYPASTANDVLVMSMAASIVLSYPVDRLLFPNKELTHMRFVLTNMAIVAIAYGIAIAVPVFSTLLGIFGAVTSTCIAYILPTFFYMRTSQKSFVNDRFSWVALTVLMVGGSAGMASFGFIVEGAAKNGLS